MQQGISNKDICCFGCHTLHKKWWWMYYFKLRDLNVWGGEYPNSLACYETISIVSDQLNFTRFCAWVDLTRWNEKCNFLGTIRQTLPFPLHRLLKPILQAFCHFEDTSIEYNFLKPWFDFFLFKVRSLPLTVHYLEEMELVSGEESL